MKTAIQYRQISNYAIATEILCDPEATPREQVLAKRIRGLQGERSDTQHYAEHKHD
jgi:hypothetical protein